MHEQGSVHRIIKHSNKCSNTGAGQKKIKCISTCNDDNVMDIMLLVINVIRTTFKKLVLKFFQINMLHYDI